LALLYRAKYPILKNSNDWYFTAIKRDPYAVMVYNTDSSGGGYCGSAPVPYTFYDTSMFTLIPSSLDFASFGVTSAAITITDSVQPQLYVDSCDYALPSSVVPITLPEGLLVYPNPASNIVYIQDTKNIDHIDICDMTGKLVTSVQSVGKIEALDLEYLKSGCYLLKITNNDNSIEYRKIVVIH